jgi:hypothetical protein
VTRHRVGEHGGTGRKDPRLRTTVAALAAAAMALALTPPASAQTGEAADAPATGASAIRDAVGELTPESRITRIDVEEVVSPAFDGASYGDVGQYETISGRAHGVLDPDDPRNAIIQDLELAPTDEDGLVEYEATFHLVKPIDMTRASGLMWHDVPNRGGRINIAPQLRERGDIGLSSGWQGDDSGGTAHDNPGRDFVVVPTATNPDGSPITGEILGRIINAEGLASSEIFVHSNPVPYEPVTLDTSESTLTIIESETPDGGTGATREVPSDEWAWATCTEEEPFPGTPNPREICIDGGFEPDRVHQVVFTAQDPPVLGIGFAAFRDVASFFKFQTEDDDGTLNPLGDAVEWVLAKGNSQSGNMLRQFLHLGFNEDTAGRQVQDGNWPIIAGRRVALNFRFAMPDGVLKRYEPGSEGPQWWSPWPDERRDLPERGILDRCTITDTCPKVIEHFGSAELWGLKLGPEWVGTDADVDIPVPDDVRRYYIPSSRHGGGSGSFDVTPPSPPSCPSVGYGEGVLPDNPVPHVETRNAIEHHFRNWVMADVEPPPSRWPLLADGELVEPTKEAMGFPTLPGLPASAPTGLINPVFDYDFGPEFDYSDGSGVMTVVPPVIKQVIPTLVPRVDSDGNEVGGVPVVLREAPLGTYLGWNIVADGFHEGDGCGYAGGMVPFATTEAERIANDDPRPSLEERYGDHAGYVAAVEAAADEAMAAGFLLPDDAAALIQRAEDSDVLGGSDAVPVVLECPDGTGSGFPDVPAESVHADTVRCGDELGLFRGKTSGEFDPAGSLTRGQAAAVLDRLATALGRPIDGDRRTFADVGGPYVHRDAIERLAGAGVIAGFEDGRFRPQDPVGRDQLASLVVRFVESSAELELELGDPFSDVPPASVHADNLRKARGAGIVLGDTEGRAHPRDDIRRDQAASLFVRSLPLLPVSD